MTKKYSLLPEGLKCSAWRKHTRPGYMNVCRWCGNCVSTAEEGWSLCIKDVPWYAVSQKCDHYTEEPAEIEVPEVSGNEVVSVRRFNALLRKSLVETV